MNSPEIDLDVHAVLQAMPLTRLVHFTPARNLPHIFIDGELRGVAELTADQRAYFTATDPHRLDGRLHMISCSFQYPNTYYLRTAQSRGNAINFPDWVFFMIDKDVAARHGALFCPRNAAAGNQIAGIEGLAECYALKVAGQGGVVRERTPRHSPQCPTDVQAEVLVPAPIPLSEVHGLVFPTEAAAEQEYRRLQRFGVAAPPIPWMTAPEMFDTQAVVKAVVQSRYLQELPWMPGGAKSVDTRPNT
ncbi:DarT ssDNA thymidine ADP-ribosyltransferase family protein [Nocardia gipuzkoensis]